MEEMKSTKKRGREIYPVDLTGTTTSALLKRAHKRSGIKSRSEVMRLALDRGLVILLEQLNAGSTASRKSA
jgi:hypothetical protein